MYTTTRPTFISPVANSRNLPPNFHQLSWAVGRSNYILKPQLILNVIQDTIDRLDDAFRAPSPLRSLFVSEETPPPSGEVDCPLLDAKLDGAIDSLRNGEIASLHEAAMRYAVPDSLLYTRYYRKDPEPVACTFGNPYNLSEADEPRVCQYIVQWLQSGFPTSPHLVREAGNALHKRKCDSLDLNFKPLEGNYRLIC